MNVAVVCTMTFLVKRLIIKLNHCTEFSSPGFPKINQSKRWPAGHVTKFSLVEKSTHWVYGRNRMNVSEQKRFNRIV